MKDDRLRISADPEYAKALGWATYAFVLLEWDAIWCCERIQPGIIPTFKRRTAGQIADEFIDLAQGNRVPSCPEKDALIKAAQRFKALSGTRNDLMHARPITDKDGSQRLSRNGTPWTIETINAAADDFTECSGVLNKFVHSKWLKSLSNPDQSL